MEIFKESANKRYDQSTEFRLIRKYISDNTLKRIQSIKSFDELEKEFGFYVIPKMSERTAELRFGRRHMRQPGINDEPPLEQGAILVYSMGSDSKIAVFLYSCVSPLAAWHVEGLALRLEEQSYIQFQNRFDADIQKLLLYCRVTSCGAKSSLYDKARVTWLEWTCPTVKDGKLSAPKWQFWAREAMGAATKGGISGLAKVLVPAIFLALLAAFGLSHCSAFRWFANPEL